MDDHQPRRRTQAERRAASRNAILEAAARGISRQGYSRLSLADVAAEAGYTRGALYHQFTSKETLALAVVGWVYETWEAEVGYLLDDSEDPAGTLLTVARQHTKYCRRHDTAALMQVLAVEFNDREQGVGKAVAEVIDGLVVRCRQLILSGRRTGVIPPGPPAGDTAEAYLSVLESVAIAVNGRKPHDLKLTERAARGVLGLPPTRAA